MNAIRFQKEFESLPGTDTLAPQKKRQNSEVFGNILARSLNEVNRLSVKAGEDIQGLAAGKQGDIHETMIALEKADVAFQLLMQVRNKIISAYETVMRMQV